MRTVTLCLALMCLVCSPVYASCCGRGNKPKPYLCHQPLRTAGRLVIVRTLEVGKELGDVVKAAFGRPTR